MGLMNKLTPKKTTAKKHVEASHEAPTIVSKGKVAPAGVAPAGVSAGHGDDESTVFTTFMILYYGFFGITLLVYPRLHCADGPFPNPLAYWTTISDETEFVFRLAGTAILTLVIGPFLDEIFGGVGVQMMAFTRQMCVANAILFVLFLYYSFYAPLDTAVPMIWQGQAMVGGLILGWNIIEVSGDMLQTYYTVFCVLEFSFFGLSLASVPALLFGPPSPFKYWESWSDLSLTCGRSVGLAMTSAFLLGFYLYSKSNGFTKMVTVWNVILTGLMVIPAYFGGDLSTDKSAGPCARAHCPPHCPLRPRAPRARLTGRRAPSRSQCGRSSS